MGITIAYRGQLADLDRIEDFEDRLIDCALEIGAQVQIWRTWADNDPERMVRGVILGIAPGHESTSLLVSPEGWLIGLIDIQDAEEGRLTEPPWCFTKTQFGPVEGHVALVELLSALKREFLPDLEVSDEGGYWETRDLAELVRKHSLMQQAIDGLAQGLRRYGISHEAAEDPSILLRHIERVAEQVRRSLRRPAEHPPVELGDEDDFSGAASPETTERLWDNLSKHNRRQQERMKRALDEQRSRGLDDETAFHDALRDVVPDLADGETAPLDEPWHDQEHPSFDEPLADEAAGQGTGFWDADEDSFEANDEERHPLLQMAMDLLVRFDSVFHEEVPRVAPARIMLHQVAGDMIGGLAQALSPRDHGAEDYDLRVVQLKRALRGVAFARGALFPLRSTVSKQQSDEFFRTLELLETDIVSELDKLRSGYRGDDR